MLQKKSKFFISSENLRFNKSFNHLHRPTLTSTPDDPTLPQLLICVYRRVKNILKWNSIAIVCFISVANTLEYQWIIPQAKTYLTDFRIWRSGIEYFDFYATPEYLEKDMPLLLTVRHQSEDVIRKQRMYFHSAYRLKHSQHSADLWETATNLY